MGREDVVHAGDIARERAIHILLAAERLQVDLVRVVVEVDQLLLSHLKHGHEVVLVVRAACHCVP